MTASAKTCCLVLATVIGLVSVAACSPSARTADSALKRLNNLSAIHTPPPGGVSLGVGSDPGSRSGISGRSPKVVAVFTTSLLPSYASQYYQQTYPEYSFSTGAPVDGVVETIGVAGGDDIEISIGSKLPSVPSQVDLDIKEPASAPVDYVVVTAQARTF